MQNKGYQWFMAGAMLGAAGVYMGNAMMSNNKRPIKKAKSTAADMASHMSRQAGEMLGAIGEQWAQKLR